MCIRDRNQAIKLSNGDWVLTLNPDVLLLPNFIQALVDAGQFDSRIGAVCGKLLTMTSHFEIPEKPVVDSTGIYFNQMCIRDSVFPETAYNSGGDAIRLLRRGVLRKLIYGPHHLALSLIHI